MRRFSKDDKRLFYFDFDFNEQTWTPACILVLTLSNVTNRGTLMSRRVWRDCSVLWPLWRRETLEPSWITEASSSAGNFEQPSAGRRAVQWLRHVSHNHLCGYWISVGLISCFSPLAANNECIKSNRTTILCFINSPNMNLNKIKWNQSRFNSSCSPHAKTWTDVIFLNY